MMLTVVGTALTDTAVTVTVGVLDLSARPFLAALKAVRRKTSRPATAIPAAPKSHQARGLTSQGAIGFGSEVGDNSMTYVPVDCRESPNQEQTGQSSPSSSNRTRSIHRTMRKVAGACVKGVGDGGCATARLDR